ncbi:MAG TPA: TerB family tellurite resistance protein [Spirochaetota bacterium]|nr:TerB family tellurite resistance protein [Spirochaetota bacterium]
MPATMTRDEKKVLIAICRYVISSDGIITDDEISRMNEIADEIGIDDYEELFNEVDSEITSEEDLHKKIDALATPKNKKKIIQYSIQLSRTDGCITHDEIDILVYAADAWGIDLKNVMKKC